MVADIGTKALISTRLETLKMKTNMVTAAKNEEKVEEKKGKSPEEAKKEGRMFAVKEKTATVIKVLIIAASLTAAKTGRRPSPERTKPSDIKLGETQCPRAQGEVQLAIGSISVQGLRRPGDLCHFALLVDPEGGSTAEVVSVAK